MSAIKFCILCKPNWLIQKFSIKSVCPISKLSAISNGCYLKSQFCTKPRPNNSESTESGHLTPSNREPHGEITLGKKVKENAKDASYLTLIVAGVGTTIMMFYAIFHELFSDDSPNGVYSRAFDEVSSNEDVANAVGTPIKGYGEISLRGRRRHVSHLEFTQDNVPHMRLKFYVEGSRQKGTAHLEVEKDKSNRYVYRYLFVELDSGRTIILHDNRVKLGAI